MGLLADWISMLNPPSKQRGKPVSRPNKPPLRLESTTLWNYPSQHYGKGVQGDPRYPGATPSYIIWNLIQRYTRPGELVVDPMCGSGTTLDVCRDTGRIGRGFDLNPYRPDIERGDARSLPIDSNVAALVFIDPPYGDHIHYSDDNRCIGKLSSYSPAYYQAMDDVLKEAHRILRPGGHLGLYVCDYYEKKRGIACVGFGLLGLAIKRFFPVDVIAVVRHHRTLLQGNYHEAAVEGNFFLRAFNHLFILKKPAPREARPPFFEALDWIRESLAKEGKK
ncbi:MAG: DNA methyltransferase [Deltaproteobacteria bacterium]|nr:DNA methyltransferase [Deltaproteobacteria bacterium]